MKALIITFTFLACTSQGTRAQSFPHQEKQQGYTLSYVNADPKMLQKTKDWMDQGVGNAEKFFQGKFNSKFDVRIHPGRHSLDSTWANDWKSPGLKTECWQVASGAATVLDLLDPSTWKKEACDHDPTDDKATGQILRHELIHVYHGQRNPSPDFADVQGLDWFVEGLATYASGQLDEQRILIVKERAASNKFPGTLNDFWTGKDRYALAGSMVAYIDKRYGRDTLVALLSATRLETLVNKLGTTEKGLIDAWAEWLRNQPTNK